jgi:hypothetical protein
MNPSEDAKQNVYQSILKTANKRLEQAIPGSSEGAFAHLSLAALLNLLFLIKGEWGSIGKRSVSTELTSGGVFAVAGRLSCGFWFLR